MNVTATIGAMLFGLLCLLAVVARIANPRGIDEPAKKEREGNAGLHEGEPGRRALRLKAGNGNRRISIKLAGGGGTILGELPQVRGKIDLNDYSIEDIKVESYTTIMGDRIDAIPANYHTFLIALRDNVDGVKVGELEFEFEGPQSETRPESALEKMLALKEKMLALKEFSSEKPGYFFASSDMLYWDTGSNLLKELHLDENEFEGTIPPTIPPDIPQKMKDLQVMFSPGLQVMFGENNKFSGTLPDNLGSLDLHLDENEFIGTLPATLGNTPNLLHGNQFTGTIPASLLVPDKLKDATLHYNPLEGEVDQSICENMYATGFGTLSVDCATIACECCICSSPGV